MDSEQTAPIGSGSTLFAIEASLTFQQTAIGALRVKLLCTLHGRFDGLVKLLISLQRLIDISLIGKL